MNVKIEILSGNSKGKCLKDIIEAALNQKKFASFNEFAQLVSKHTKNSVHAEVECLSRITRGQSNRLAHERAKVYAELLDIPEKNLLELAALGNFHKTSKPIILGDDTDVTSIVKKLAQKQSVSLEDLVKEFLYMQHQ